MSLETGIQLYRIAQEALHNVVKHAPRAAVQVEKEEAKQLQLAIGDEGPSFDRKKAKSQGGLGLLSRQERAPLAGGNLSLSTRLGQGTTLVVRVPVERQS